MTPQAFVEKWQSIPHKKERKLALEHFNDLCDMLGIERPSTADVSGLQFSAEMKVLKDDGGVGFADVAKRGFFAWEYKTEGKDLDKAKAQLKRYIDDLDNPPLLIVSDMALIRIYTNFNSTVNTVIDIPLAAIPHHLDTLTAIFTNPERLNPRHYRERITEEIAAQFAGMGEKLRQRGHDPATVSHFLGKLLFCMYAEDAGLFPQGRKVFSEVLEACHDSEKYCEEMFRQLFRAMQNGGRFGTMAIAYFNGSLFADDDTLPLNKADIKTLLQAADRDWKDIEPSIFGTLFERGLNPEKQDELSEGEKERHIGVNYTDQASIALIIEPVIIKPLAQEWRQIFTDLEELEDKYNNEELTLQTRNKARKKAQQQVNEFLERLSKIRVLDPACGSGNFLYSALRALKNFEKHVIESTEALGLQAQLGFNISPRNIYGIEINSYAAELAKITVWIGYIQWNKEQGGGHHEQPILAPLMLADEAFFENANMSQIKTILTFCFRGERFSHGHWENMIKKGYIRQLLQRLAELNKF
jgi:hypothetical protein